MARRYWLFKSEPTAFSIADLKASPQHTTGWDGVRNYQPMGRRGQNQPSVFPVRRASETMRDPFRARCAGVGAAGSVGAWRETGGLARSAGPRAPASGALCTASQALVKCARGLSLSPYGVV